MFLILVCHVCFIAAEFVIYDNMFEKVIWEGAAMYVNYYGIMSLSSIIIFVYCAFLEALFVMWALTVISVMAEDHWLAPICFFVQLFTYGYGGYILFGKLRKYRNADPKTDKMTPEEIKEDGGKVKKEKKKSADEETPAPRPSQIPNADQMQQQVAVETGKALAAGIIAGAE